LGDGVEIAAEREAMHPHEMIPSQTPGIGWNALHSVVAVGSAVGLHALMEGVGPGTLRELWLGGDAMGHLPIALAVAAARPHMVQALLSCMSTCQLDATALNGDGDAAEGRSEAWGLYRASMPVLADMVLAHVSVQASEDLQHSSLAAFAALACLEDAKAVHEMLVLAGAPGPR
jgi:hypothetical protein